MAELPVEILEVILCALGVTDLIRCRQVSTKSSSSPQMQKSYSLYRTTLAMITPIVGQQEILVFDRHQHNHPAAHRVCFDEYRAGQFSQLEVHVCSVVASHPRVPEGLEDSQVDKDT